MSSNARTLAKQLIVGKAKKGRELAGRFGHAPKKPVERVTPIGRSFDNHQGIIALLGINQHLEDSQIENPYFNAWSERKGSRLLIDNQWKINFSSYNYLDMASDADLAEAAKQAIDQYGTSVSAARIVSGQIPLYEELEAEFADFFGTEDALIFVSGFLTNVSTIGYLFGEKDLIVHDALIHNSMISGALMAGSRRLNFAHNDAEALDKLLKIHRNRHERCVVLIEGVYSMDGDVGNVQAIIEVANRHHCSVMLDEAHSLGTIGKTGRGAQEAMDIKPDDVDIWMGSLSKSLGSVGGYIAGSRMLIENLRYYAPGAALYCATTPPASAAAALCALRKLKTETWRVKNLQENSSYFLKRANELGLNTGISDGTAVVPIIIGDTNIALELTARLNKQGINVQAIFHPVVPDGEARLRFFINTAHTPKELDYTLNKIVENMKDIRPS
ncbi:MAG: aminotransferase class I/II-fold pyridoxal phosphate-dependent enzyme [Cocleimonas sp.]|nr:aminotransferase class I/II-fold pyridoxal phosphate-dependent enzyme [Cocleimonas sp.]